MFCTDCGSRNPNDSKFCRECGRKILSLEDNSKLSPTRASKVLNMDRAHEGPAEPDKLRDLLDMAFWHNEVGNMSGAQMACEAALKVDPYSTSALSLLGVVYEKQGNDQKAIETFQRVVELNPDSVADAEKLEHLLRGIRDRAVSPSLIHQFAPPVLIKAVRKYPSMPLIASLAVVTILVGCGLKAVWDKFVTVPRESPAAIGNVSAAMLPIPSSSAISPPLAPNSPAASNPYQYSAPAAAQAPPVQSHDPFYTEQPSTLEQIARSQNSEDSSSPSRSSSVQDAGSSTMPSIGALRPLVVQSSPVPDHVVPVGETTSANDHVVIVGPTSATDQSQPSTDSDGGDDLPSPPASHIFVTVHGGSQSSVAEDSTPVPSDSHMHSISLSENVGASLQQKGLNFQETGNYKAATTAYKSAIAAYQQDIANGRNTDEAQRGIDACQVAVEICKQSQ